MCDGCDEHLGGLGMVQVPELDMPVAGSNKVGAVVREGDGGHFTGHLIGCYDDVFLMNIQNKNNKAVCFKFD